MDKHQAPAPDRDRTSALSGVPAEMIEQYELLGILAPAAQSSDSADQSSYGQAPLVRVVRAMDSLDFTIPEMREITDLLQDLDAPRRWRISTLLESLYLRRAARPEADRAVSELLALVRSRSRSPGPS